MKTLDYSGLNSEATRGVVSGLQQLLADYQIFYTNLRGLHWNVKGKEFYILHAEFERLYNDVNAKVDEIAERILQLDGTPASSYATYLSTSGVKELSTLNDGEVGLQHVMETYKHFIALERNILAEASKAGDEVTVALMSEYLSGQEKALWMLTSYFTR